MRKKLAISIFGAIIALLVITSFVLLDNTFPLKSQISNWKCNLDNFATAVAFDKGKVFVTDNPGNVECLDASSGYVIWTTNAGGWTSNAHLITVSKGIVYVGAGGGVVDTLSETSGKLLPLSFTAPVTTSWGQKQAPQQFFVSEGRIFISQNGWGGTDIYKGIICSLDLTSGQVLWKTTISQNVSISGSGNVVTTELGLKLLNNRVFLTSGSDLITISESSGFVEGTQHFDHYVLAPVAGDKQVFVAGDLGVFSYK
jgi:outer membrane protein assembly factor BamB